MNDLSPDQQWLLGDAAGPWLSRAAGELADSVVTPRLVQSLRKDLGPERTTLIIELAQLRKRAREKFSLADQMYFSARGLEQATDEVLARYKARRFPEQESITDFCSGIGGDAQGFSQRGPVGLVDLDRFALACAERNIQLVSGRATAFCSDVATYSLDGNACWHIDPDRRPEGQRSSQPDFSSPSPDVIQKLLAMSPQAALKLAPAARLTEPWLTSGEMQWLESRGECRQLMVWLGDLARWPGERVATLVDAMGQAFSWRGAAQADIDLADEPEIWIGDPAPCLRAAGLVADWCQNNEARLLSRSSQYVTSSRQWRTPLVSTFRLVQTLPFDIVALRTLFQKGDIGTLEIKPRGLDITPEKLRPQMKLRGDRAAVLFLVEMHARRLALVCERVAETLV